MYSSPKLLKFLEWNILLIIHLINKKIINIINIL